MRSAEAADHEIVAARARRGDGGCMRLLARADHEIAWANIVSRSCHGEWSCAVTSSVVSRAALPNAATEASAIGARICSQKKAGQNGSGEARSWNSRALFV